MSGFGAGQFDDAEGAIERRIQEEIRARQASAAAASRVGSALSRTGFSTTADRAFMTSLIAAETAAAGSGASPYYGQRVAAAAAAGAHSPFARPYSALGQQSATAYAVGHSPTDAVTASLYARQRAQYGYAATPTAAAERGFHGYAVPSSHELYSQHFGRSAQEMSLIDRAAAYNAQQRQAEQQSAALLQQAAASKAPVAPLNASTMSYIQKGTPKIPSPKPTKK